MKKNNPAKFLILTFIIMGTVAVVVSIVLSVININIKNSYISTDAVIVGFETKRSSDGDTHKSTIVAYSVSGNAYESSVSSYSSAWHVGDTITVYRDPDNPAKVTTGVPIIMCSVFAIIGMIFALVGVKLLLKEKKLGKKKKNLIENGLTLNARIIDFSVNTRIEVNHEHPFIIVAEYDDGIQKHRFKSENVWQHITTQQLGQNVTIYYEPNNMDNYYMDTDSLLKCDYKLDENVIYH